MTKPNLRWLLCGLLATAVLQGCNTSSDGMTGDAVLQSSPGGETSERNAQFLAPDLDVDDWADRFSGESREVYVARKVVTAALDLEPGHVVADIGAGTGLYVREFSPVIGRTGRVFATDISQPFLDFIERNAADDGLDNVEVVLGSATATGLGAASVDVVFHSDTYHHFDDPASMNRDILTALRSGGRLFVLDFDRVEGVSSPFVMKHVRAGKDTVVAEIERAGFIFVEELDIEGLRENYLLEFRKP